MAFEMMLDESSCFKRLCNLGSYCSMLQDVDLCKDFWMCSSSFDIRLNYYGLLCLFVVLNQFCGHWSLNDALHFGIYQ